MRGQVREAEVVIQKTMLSFPAVPGWTAAWGAIIWDLGQHDNARACLARSMARGVLSIRSEPAGLANCSALAELCCKVGDAAAAKAIYDVLSPFAEYHGLLTMGSATYGPLHRQLGALAECQDDAPLAELHYRAALAAAKRMRSPVYLSGTSYRFAHMLLRSGDARQRPRAAALLGDALRLAERCELLSIAEVARRVAARHGLALEALAAGGGDVLGGLPS